MPKRITIDIDTTGKVVIEDDHGEATDVVKDLEESLGVATGSHRTCAGPAKTPQQNIRQKG